MSFIVAGISLGVGAAAGGALNYAASKNAGPDEEWNSQVWGMANEDAEIQRWGKEEYVYGQINPFDNPDVPPYSSSDIRTGGKPGYYYDKRDGVYVTKQQYLERSKNEENRLDPNRFVWQEAKLKEGVSEQTGQAWLNHMITEANIDMFPDLKNLAKQEIASVAANLPYKTEAEKIAYLADTAKSQTAIDTAAGITGATNAANQFIIDTTPGKTEATKAANLYTTQLYGAKTPVMQKYYQQALQGMDVKGAMDEANQAIAHQYDINKGVYERNMRALGIDPADIASGMSDWSRNRAKDIVAASMTAKKDAEAINFNRLAGAMGVS